MSNSRLIILVLFLGVLMAAMDIAIVGPLLRPIGETFNVTERDLAWVFIVFSLFAQLGLPLMTRASDLFGRRFAFSICLAIFSIGTLGVVLSPTFQSLLMARALQGFGVSGVLPTASAVIGDLYQVEKRGKMLGLIGAVFGIAFIIGPILSGVLIEYGWRTLFMLNIVPAFILSIVGWRVLPAAKKDDQRSLDWGGVITLGVALVALALGINRLDTSNLLSSLLQPSIWGMIALFWVGLGFFLWIETRVADPFLRLSFFKSGQVRRACIISSTSGMCEAVFVFLPSFAGLAFSVSDKEASFMLLPLVFALAIGSPLAGRLLDRVGSRIIVTVGLLMAGAGMLGLYFGAGTTFSYYVSICLIGAGLSALLGSALSYIILNESDVKERAVAQGLLRLFKGLGRLIGGAMIGAVIGSSAGLPSAYQRAFLIVGILVMMSLFLSLTLKRRKEEFGAVH